jgi:iron complex outermembrane receptor protein
MYKQNKFFTILLNVLSVAVIPCSSAIATEISQENLLFDMNLEQLMSIQVTSVMKTPTRLSDTPGAIFVLSNEDIRRTGATSIPEALRMVPGMNVSRIDANKWAITARGFNGEFANKLLVLVDGRSVYTPLFSGVWWDQQDVMMEDIERIEVIRGPGASLWGANAVNGVINIITKNAQNTQGGLLSAHGGNARAGAGLRYGSKVGEDSYLKVYGMDTVHRSTTLVDSNAEAGDFTRLNKGGFRFDSEVSGNDKLTLQGDAHDGVSGGAPQTVPTLTANLVPQLAPPYSEEMPTAQEFQGYNLLGRWERRISDSSSTALQLYWNNEKRNLVFTGTKNQVDTLDIDFQHNLKLSERQNIVWGAGYRNNRGKSSNGKVLVFTNTDISDDITSLFAQDDITLVPSLWKLTLGTRIERNPSNDLAVQPNIRLLWTPNDQQSIWASVSRAMRTPDWVEQSVSYSIATIPPTPAPTPAVMLGVTGSPTFTSEKLTAYELGWRGVVKPNLTADLALYYYDYKDAQSLAPNPPDFNNIGSGYVVQTMSFSNYGKVRSYGSEVSLDWKATENWNLRASYSYFDSDFSLVSSAPAGTLVAYDQAYPGNQAILWSQHKLSPKLNLDLSLRYNSGMHVTPVVSAYTAFDARLAWSVQRDIEASLVGRNLLGPEHAEYGSDFTSVATTIPREIFANLKIGF